MRALPSLLLAVALLAPLTAPVAAQDAPGRAYAGKASTCDVLRLLLHVQVGPPCPDVRQAGTATPLGCQGTKCTLHVAGAAEGGGLHLVRKTLDAEVYLGTTRLATVCANETSTGWTLQCGGDATVPFTLMPGTCREVRIRATLVELADVPPHLYVRTETAFNACRETDATFTLR